MYSHRKTGRYPKDLHFFVSSPYESTNVSESTRRSKPLISSLREIERTDRLRHPNEGIKESQAYECPDPAELESCNVSSPTPVKAVSG